MLIQYIIEKQLVSYETIRYKESSLLQTFDLFIIDSHHSQLLLCLIYPEIWIPIIIIIEQTWDAQVLQIMKYLVANFDGYHFLTNKYSHLPNFAFLPTFTALTQIIDHYIPYSLLIIAIMNKLFFWFSIKYLYKICHHLHLSQHLQIKCIFIYIYNPVFVFFHSVYSQSLYAFLTFAFIENQLRQHFSKIKSTILLTLAILVRSTAIFLLPIIGIQILYNLYIWTTKKNIKKMLKQITIGLFILICTIGIFMLYLLWAYNRVCTSMRPLLQCRTSTFVNIYSYVQSHYWDVGFFTYYKLNNIVFILIGLPSIIFAIISLNKPKTIQQLGLQLSYWILLLITIFMTNIQSSTRFLCTHPIFFINLVIYFYQQQQYRSIHKRIIHKVFKLWQISYFYIGIVLFAVQFPWT